MLKAHGHLLPPELEERANEQRAEDRAAAERQRAAALEGGARVLVQAARPSPALKLQRSRSQELRAALEHPAAREALAQAAQLAAKGRVLGAHAQLLHAAKHAGGSLAELAALPREALAAALPPGASLEVEAVVRDAAWATDALAALEDHSGWMTSRSDALQVHYRHQRGTTVHRCRAGLGRGHGAVRVLRVRQCCARAPAWMAAGPAVPWHAVLPLQKDAEPMLRRCPPRPPLLRACCSLKFAAVFDHPLEHLLALCHEFDLIPTWNKWAARSFVCYFLKPAASACNSCSR